MALKKRTGADVAVETLEAHGVTHIFGVPGAKIDKVFDRLRDSSLKTVVCRHEHEIAPTVRKAFDTPGPVLIEGHVDYRENIKLFEDVHEGSVL